MGLLRGLTSDHISALRNALFNECKRSNFCEGDQLRSRLEGRGRKQLKECLCEDVWLLVQNIRGRKKLPNLILSNGNRSASYLAKPRAATISTSQATSLDPWGSIDSM